MDNSELTDELFRLSKRMLALEDDARKRDQQVEVLLVELNQKIAELERIREQPITISPQIKMLDDGVANNLIWVCTPTQHSLILLILTGASNQEIADRVGTTVASIKTRFRHLCGRLSIKGRADLNANYKLVIKEASDEDFLERAQIPKDWAEKYGKLTFKQAKNKDPYHVTICETHYRGIAMV
ncbi:MAG: hypothetical protein RPR28_01045 [Cycloclasticus sp.]